jgi:hypothetical protein
VKKKTMPRIPPPPPAPELMLSAEARRATSTFAVSIGGNRFVRCQWLDLPTMVMEGLVPMALLGAAQRMTQGLSEVEKLETMTPDERRDLLDMMRRFAIASVVEPKIVSAEADTGAPGTLPVTMLAFDELMLIWTKASVRPLVGAAKARTFRGNGGEPDAPDVPHGVEVRPQPVVVAPAAEPTIKHQ